MRALSRRLSSRWSAVRRDVSMLLGGLMGRRPPHLIRHPSTHVKTTGAAQGTATGEPDPGIGSALPVRSPSSRRASASSTDVTIRFDGVDHVVSAGPGVTLLDAGLQAGLDMPFSCAMGGCATCRVRLREGEVDVDEPTCLSDEERSQGYVLACSSRPRRGCVVEVET